MDVCSERQNREEELRRLATILRKGRRVSDSRDAVTMHDLRGHILAWNRGAESMYGYSEEEALQMNMEDLVPEGA